MKNEHELAQEIATAQYQAAARIWQRELNIWHNQKQEDQAQAARVALAYTACQQAYTRIEEARIHDATNRPQQPA